MFRFTAATPLLALALTLVAAASLQAQSDGPLRPPPTIKPDQNSAPPRSDDSDRPDVAPPAGADESSSRDTKVDLSPPTNDSKQHPDSAAANDVTEFHPWDPHKAEKNIEIGDFYYKKGNYTAA